MNKIKVSILISMLFVFCGCEDKLNKWQDISYNKTILDCSSPISLAKHLDSLYLGFIEKNEKKEESGYLRVAKLSNGKWFLINDSILNNLEVTAVKIYSHNDNLYLLYCSSYDEGLKANVLMYAKNKWSFIGRNLSFGSATNISIATINNSPVIAFFDSESKESISILKFEDNKWTNIFNNKILNSISIKEERSGKFNISDISLINHANTIYFSFVMGYKIFTPCVFAFENDGWKDENISSVVKSASHISLVSAKENGLFAATINNKVFIMRNAGNEWTEISRGLNEETQIQETKLASNNLGVYLASIDNMNSNKITVFNLDESWKITGNRYVSNKFAKRLDLISDDNNLYIAYVDESQSNLLKIKTIQLQ